MAMILQVSPSSTTPWHTRNPKIRFFSSSIQVSYSKKFRCRAVREETEEKNTSPSPEEITKKYGLEVGLWKILSSKDEETDGENKTKKSKQTKLRSCLLTLLLKVGISTNETGEKVGAFALAYAAHKAASPIRFPPTVALTPIVANWIGKKVDKEKDE
ncbi:hypothetical protein Bca52824_045722 [Brassica carinata]|uniref:DUF1279 domain-containing protein n=1 Tax=Brassica carinata TaxID=52824 RepID=A0A8X7RB74_BRACI|nr:hypothetical protein Bca52824_045722 [Brassica carinata]